jgi:hypothetical protein
MAYSRMALNKMTFIKQKFGRMTLRTLLHCSVVSFCCKTQTSVITSNVNPLNVVAPKKTLSTFYSSTDWHCKLDSFTTVRQNVLLTQTTQAITSYFKIESNLILKDKTNPKRLLAPDSLVQIQPGVCTIKLFKKIINSVSNKL